MFGAGFDQVGLSLRCTGTAVAIAETVEEFREMAPGCEVEVHGEPHTATTAPLASLRRIFGAGLGQVSTSPRSTGGAAATQTVNKSRKAARRTKEAHGEPHTANTGNPFPPPAHSTLVPPVPPSKARCTATADAGARCVERAGPDGLCLFHRLEGPQPNAT
jgi:hypothetical protein